MARAASSTVTCIGLAATLAVAGCLGDPLDAVGDENPMAPANVWSVLFDQGCVEGGFVAPYNMEPGEWLVEPFVRGDIREEIDDPMLVSTGVAAGGPLTGNWHQGFQCPTAVLNGEVVKDFIFGWVGQVIEPPGWNPGGADLHAYTTGFGLANGTIRDSLLDVSMLDVTQTYDAQIVHYADNVVYEVMKDLPKGIYESTGTVEEYRDVEPRTLRLWWLVPSDGSRSPLGHFHAEDVALPGGAAEDHAMDVEAMTWHPVYVDLVTGGGPQWVAPDTVSHACHSGVPQHGPQGGLCVPEITVLYEHRSLALEYGRVFTEVTVDDFYFH